MRIVLIEDEKLAADRLKKLVNTALPEAVIEGPLNSVKKAVAWFQQEEAPDLAFFDIQLADGLSFEIFEHVQVKAPIIFTTAYDEYAIKAFKVNSVDYLLKPIQEEALQQAVQKFNQLIQPKPLLDPVVLEKMMLNMNRQYKSRFVVKIGKHIHAVLVEEVLYFFSEEKVTFLVTRSYLINRDLNQ